ncbi:uncharacterized protein [Primulina huaijiensis]|uniref:uncharacterized protein isoform X2 n=1 Tax=Primulina huaijiensis TaxID=1492673 RepID=UPI003CC76550
MVGKRTGSISRAKISGRINSVKYGGSGDIASKLNQLRRLREELCGADSVLLEEFLYPLLDLLSDSFSPVRKSITEIVGQIGSKHSEFLPEIVPALINILKDDAPAVARQAITCAIDIFRCTLIKGLYSSEFDESLKSSWEYVLKLRDEIYSLAFKVGSDGRRLPALKFVESVVLLYSPDPNGSLEPSSDQVSEEEFNVSWLRGGHPILNVGDLSLEASKSVGKLLDQLRLPAVKSVSNLMIIVLIKSLSTVARKRPAFYGRILPVLLGLDPSVSASEDFHISGSRHALKNAFECCLNCTHPGAVPWRDRLLSALSEMELGKSSEQEWNLMRENNGTIDLKDDSHISQTHEDGKSSDGALAVEQSYAGRKRPGLHDGSDFNQDNMSGKRVKSTVGVIDGSVHDPKGNQVNVPSVGRASSITAAESGPVPQLVAMFSTLVAQGEKAAASLEILISSISADLLADVVMANIRNLPPIYPKSEGDEVPLLDIGPPPGVEHDAHIKNLSLLLTEILSHPSSSQLKEDKTGSHHHSGLRELEHAQEEEVTQATVGDGNVAYDGLDFSSQQASVSTVESGSREDIPSGIHTGHSAIKSEVTDAKLQEEEIPGLSLSIQDGRIDENLTALLSNSTNLEDANNDKATNFGNSPVELAQSLSTDRSEELSPKVAVTDSTSINSSTPTSLGMIAQLVFPKITAPVIVLVDEQKDQLQELAFLRIIDAYKQVTAAGGWQLRVSILAHSGIEFPSELDPWKLLKMHIFSDYVKHEGHEITLRVLYRLFGEAEEDRDFFSSTTATSVYETFLLHVSETLRDSFPASDKSLNRLLGEVPYLPNSIFKLLECLCSPGCNADDKELHGGDRVIQGLSIVWSLILLRPPIRDATLKIALKSSVHHLEEVSMKAIRLVANKLYPLSFISEKIEDFAKEMLLSVANDNQTVVTNEADVMQLLMDEKISSENQPTGAKINNIADDTQHVATSASGQSSAVAEVQRCMSLFFALCTKKHSLIRQIFDVYKSMSEVAKQAVHHQLPLLVRTIGSSHELLDIMSDFPSESEELLMQAVHTLTDGTIPSPELLATIRRLYDTKIKDVDILIPILPFLPKNEVMRIFPYLVNAPPDKFQVALSRVIQGLNNSGPVLTPAESLIAIHGIDPERDGIPLKKVTDACNVCFEQRDIFSQQVLAKVLNQLVEQIPLPLLFMRTVLQAIGAFPSLVEFIMEILSRLVSKQIWKYPKLWVGFMKCALLTKPQSFGVLLQLPPAQLENALNRTPALKSPLVAHANQPHIRSSLPRSSLVVLGIASDAQASSQPKPTQSQSVENGNSNKEAVTDVSKESST